MIPAVSSPAVPISTLDTAPLRRRAKPQIDEEDCASDNGFITSWPVNRRSVLRLPAMLACAVAALFLVGVAGATGSASFPDRVGDAGSSLDITRLDVSEEGGYLTVQITSQAATTGTSAGPRRSSRSTPTRIPTLGAPSTGPRSRSRSRPSHSTGPGQCCSVPMVGTSDA